MAAALLAAWFFTLAVAVRPSVDETQMGTVESDPEEQLERLEAETMSSFMEGAEKPSLTLSPKDAARKSMERECILHKAELYGRIYKKFGGQWSDQNQTQLVEDVIALQEYEEQKDNTWASFSTKEKLLRFVVKGKKLKQIGEQLKDIGKNISSTGFNYGSVHKRCQDLEDEDTYACMQEKRPEVSETLRDYVDAEDMLTHCKSNVFSKSSKECKAAKNSKQKSQTTLKKSSVNLKKLKKECKAEVEKKTEDFMSFVSNQLRSTTESKRHCIEDLQKGYCPEGTAPRNGRDIDPVKGAKWFAIGYVGSYAGGWFLLAVTLALIAAPAGPAGMLAGLAVGTALAQMIPSTAIGSAMFAWNSIGPKECACYPRDCDMETDICVLKSGVEASSNPYGLAVPYPSMKCVEVKKGTCSLQSCETADYKEIHNSTSSIYGKLGRVGSGLYNCLSSEPRPQKALANQEILPNGKQNTAMNRAEIFKSLALKEKREI